MARILDRAYYEVFGWISLVPIVIAGFHTALLLEFIMDPQFQPPVTLAVVFFWFCLGAIDVGAAYLFINFYYVFWNLIWITKGFVILLIPSIFSSIYLAWTFWKEKRGILVDLALMLFMSPYWFVAVVFSLVVIIRFFAISLFSF